MIIDFKELEQGEELENLVYCLLKKRPEIIKVESTGRGNDFEADLILHIGVKNPFDEAPKIKKGIVQCKHKAMSGKSVLKGEVRPLDALLNYKATYYLLVTTTCVGSYNMKLINEINANPSDIYTAHVWDANNLETFLLSEENEDLFMRFFPKSYKEYIKLKRENSQTLTSITKYISSDIEFIIEERKKIMINKDTDMTILHLITNLKKTNPIVEATLREFCKEYGIQITTSLDVHSDWLLSIDKSKDIDKYITTADAVFAIVTKKDRESFNIWMEIEKAYYNDKLKAIFIDESLYSVINMSHLPCILLKRNINNSINDFISYYRSVYQNWGEKSDRWFWCGLATILSYHNYPIPRNA